MTFQHPYFEDFAERLTSLHNQAKEVVTGLPREALTWVPGEDMNSIAVLVTHSCGAERFWIEAMAGGAASDRVRAAEFTVEQATEAELITMLDETLAICTSTLQSLTLADLERERYGEPWDRHFRAGWSLLHALDHSALHVGHIQVTRQMWEMQVKS